MQKELDVFMLASLLNVQSYPSDKCSLDGAVSQDGETTDGGLVCRVGQAHKEGVMAQF